jgi:hypothetical protein
MNRIKKLLFLTDTRIPTDRAIAVRVRKLLPAMWTICEEVKLLINKGYNTKFRGFKEKVKHTTIKLPLLGEAFIGRFAFLVNNSKSVKLM